MGTRSPNNEYNEARNSRRFLSESQKTLAYKTTLASIKALTKEGLGFSERCAAEALSSPILESWVARKGLRLSPADRCIHKLAKKRCDGNCHLAALDHRRSWNKDGKLACITGHPYGLSKSGLMELVNTCTKLGLDYDIDANSWHFLGATVLVTIWKDPIE